MFDKSVEYARFIEVVTQKESNAIAYARLVGILSVAVKYRMTVDETNAQIESFLKEVEA